MNKKIITSTLIFLFSSVSVSACTNLKSSSELLSCKKEVEAISRAKMQKAYLNLDKYLSGAVDYQKKIKLSQESWAKSATQNCDVYSYFAEEGSVAHDIAISECMASEYKSREEFIISLSDVVEQFF